MAACFLDSMTTLDMAGFGYGIHYEYGLFMHEIDNGYQREKPETSVAMDIKKSGGENIEGILCK